MIGPQPPVSILDHFSAASQADEDTDTVGVTNRALPTDDETAREIKQEMAKKLLWDTQFIKGVNDVIRNIATEKLSFWFCLYGFAGVVLSIVLTSIITIWPQHNVIMMPQYWYELILSYVFGWSIGVGAVVVTTCSYSMNTDKIKTWQATFTIFIATSVSYLLSYVCLSTIWYHVLHFQHPMPMIGYSSIALTLIWIFVSNWFVFTPQWRKNKVFRRRLWFWMLALFINVSNSWTYNAVAILFRIIPENYQWIAAIFSPLLREFNTWSFTKMCEKAAGCKANGPQISCAHTCGARHALFLTFMLGSVATELSSYIILAIDFLINIYLAFKIIWLHKRHGPIEKQIDAIQELVINETVETMIPITYSLILLIAFYGPNAHILGDIQNGYWQYTAITDLGASLQNVGRFFICDFVSCILSFLLLFKCCNINTLLVYQRMQKEFWILFAAQQSYLLLEVRFSLLFT